MSEVLSDFDSVKLHFVNIRTEHGAAISEELAVRGTPCTILYGADGTIQERFEGAADAGRLRKFLENYDF